MARPLSPEQLAALRLMPIGDSPNKVKLAIALVGCQQSDIVEETELQPSHVSKIATGRIESIDVDIARKLANFFGCDIEDLFPARAA